MQPDAMQPDAFLAGVAERLRADGAVVDRQLLAGGPVLVGYRTQFRLRWMATKLHLFTVVATADVADAPALERLSHDALEFGIHARGQLRGFQVGVAAIPILAARSVDAGAIAYAHDVLVRQWSAFAWPCVVDLATGRSYFHQGSVLLGGFYAGWMRKQTALAVGQRQP